MENSEDLFHSIVETASDAIVAIDSGGKIIFWNRAAGTLFGYSADEMKNKHLTDLMPERFRESQGKTLSRAFSTGQSDLAGETIELSGCRQDGSEFPLKLSLSPWKSGEEVFFTATIRDITERKQAEEKLKEYSEHLEEMVEERTKELLKSQERFSGLYNSSKDAIGWASPDGTLLDVNNAFPTLTGYSKEELLAGRKYQDLTPPEYHEREAKLIENVLRTGEPTEYEKEYLRKDGSRVPILLTVFVVKGADGKPIGVAAIIKDITDRKRAEEALQESEEKYRTIFENVSDSITYVDKYGMIISANDKEAIFGRKPEEIIGRKFTELGYFNVKDIPKYLKLFKNVLTGKKTINLMELEIKHKDGHKIPIEANISLVKKNGKIEGFLCVARDISKRKQAEKELRESELQYRTLGETIPYGVWTTDATGYCTYVSDSFIELVDMTMEQIQKFGWLHLLPPEDVEPTKEHWLHCVHTGEDFEREHRFRAKDGSYRNILAIGRPIKDNTGKIIKWVGINLDITERKQAEETLRESEEKLRLLFEHVPVGIFQSTPGGRLFTANPALVDILGYDSEDDMKSINTTRDLYVNPEDRDASSRELESTGELRNVELNLKRKDGAPITVLENAYVVRDIHGNAKYYEGMIADITERKRAEEALRESEERYRSLVESTDDSVYLIGRDMRYEFANRKYLSRLGLSLAELRGQEYGKLHPSDTSEGFAKKIDQVVKSGKPMVYEHLSHRDDRYFLRTLSPVTGEKPGEIRAITVTSKDITERKRAEEKLRQSEERFRQFFENEPGYCYMISLEGLILNVNTAALEALGYQKEELVGKPLETIYAPESLPKMKQLLAKWQETGRFKDEEIVIITKEGDRRNVLLSADAVKDSDGKILHSVSVQRDITERKRAEEALWNSQEYAHNIVDSSLDMIIAVDNERRITAFNTAAVETFGHESEEVLGKHVNLLYADPKEGLRVHKKTVKHGHHIQEILNRRKNGELFPCLLSASVLYDADGNRVGVMGVSRDIAERKQAEEKLRHYASELERSNKELQQFAHAVSHDLQEPLRTIRSYLQLLADRYQQQLDADADTFIAYAVDGANRMREQIRGILALSKVGSESKELEPIDCEHVLESILTGLQKTIKGTHTQITHDPLPTVMADRTQMGQLLQNLIENAIKFRREEPPCVHLSAREEGDNWLFSVRDNGIGIDPEQTERIFKIFQRLAPQNKYPGTGIGLTICKKIVERHGGRIWVEAVPGEGSTFYFTIVK